MAVDPRYSSDVAFSPSIKAVQARKGSRATYARMEATGAWPTSVNAELAEFIESQTSVFFATASADGQPYVQHRGGPPGFLRVLDEHTIAFADFRGNRQYITLGNLAENSKAHLLLIDYATRRRVKLWGEASVVEGDEGLIAQLTQRGYRARVEQVMVFSLRAWDANCRQHIPQRVDATAVAAVLAKRDATIAALEREVERLRGG
jgi:predicted pyridoxine 5'-phosphate oxidase superfamily flavin-nucleotide-binding protein